MVQKQLQGKPVSASKVEMTELVLPGQTNTLGNIFGGRVMQLIDIAAGVAAMRHARKTVVTVFIDQLHFKNPIKMGQIMILHARVEFTGNTSMEVGVDVFSEDPLTGEQTHATTAHLTFVALDQSGKPAPVPPLILETAAEKRLFEEAGKRRERRLKY
ncbi:MAG TPA: acyl-CoA thioesterase [Bacteroidetes bacterium]|nr:acyl-CoA thioesterase [Bacteroidota bacterium]